MEWVYEVVAGGILALVGTLFIMFDRRVSHLEDKIAHCVEKDDMEYLKDTLKDLSDLVTDLRVENARWQGLLEKVLEEKSSKNS